MEDPSLYHSAEHVVMEDPSLYHSAEHVYPPYRLLVFMLSNW